MNDEQTTRPPMPENPITCANLFKALSAAQGDLVNPKKDTKGYNYKYATLDQVVEILRNTLPKYGLCYMQNPIPAAEGQVSVQTIVGHESGEHISSVLTMPMVTTGQNNSAQNYGGTLTYIRRYALTSVFGIESESDDDARGVDPPKKTADLRSAASDEPKKTEKKTKLPSQLAEEKKLIEQVKQRIVETETGEMCAANGFNPETADTAVLRGFLAQPDAMLQGKLKAFKKLQEEEE